MGYAPVDQAELAQSYGELFSRIYSTRGDAIEYENACLPQTFQLSDFFRVLASPFTEYVFACPFKSAPNGPVYVYYVTKEYHVVDGSRRIGRFLFPDRATGPPLREYLTVLLAEEPAESYAASVDFNLELRYLSRRRDRPAPENRELDPVCKLIVDGPSNQERRLCTMVLSSSHYRHTVESSIGALVGDFYGCVESQVGFQTKEASEEAVDRPYTELMTRCMARTAERRFKYFYISRAYASGEVG